MSGPTLTVTVLPAAESTQPSFPTPSPPAPPARPSPSPTDRQSSSDNASVQAPTLLPRVAPSHGRSLSANIPHTSSPAFDVPSFDFGPDFDTTFSFSSTETSKDDTDETPAVAGNQDSMAGPEPRMGKDGKRRTSITRPQSWMPSSRPSLSILTSPEEDAGREPVADSEETTDSQFLAPGVGTGTQERHRSVPDSLTSLTKRSWISGSRSPSPGKKDEGLDAASDAQLGRERSASNSSIMKLRKAPRKLLASPADGDSNNKSADPPALGKFGTYLNKIKQRPPSMLSKGKLHSDRDSPASSTASIAPPSLDTRQSHASETSNSTFPEDGTLARMPQARDPLWSTFKALDSDSHKFQTKSTSLKTGMIKAILVPFLKGYAGHSSNRMLHYEDLERRALILNKWWNALLELLDGKTQQPVAGVDRPVLLDAITLLMMRPEWRQCSANFSPLPDRNPRERLRTPSRTSCDKSSTSVDSTDSAYLAESARHNVKTMFVTNLVTQMAIVVDKLSLRHAPLSLVNFAGKACAYAFFFAPGIADILVRLWSLTPDKIRRVADEFGLPRRGRDEADATALFPHCVDKLCWTSAKALSESFKQAAKLPLTAAKIAWRGPWVSRWTGRDTDLFFVFCKYYYILAEEFMPADWPLSEKARAPGFVLVSAQVLSILDSTIHRQAAVEAMLGPPLTDAVHGTDASAMALPAAPNNNIMKGMNENRLILLLKDMLSPASTLFVGARHTFAKLFTAIMRAAAKRTSQFDHNACFTLCDFLEESLVAYDNFVDVEKPETNYVDWPFWLDVCKKMMDSSNTMSEIRVLSLLFSIWEVIAGDPSRKEMFSLGWLLTEEVFNKLFNNWCPMVRAYYMRLLCWRVCRDAGSSSDLDTKVFLVVYSRLKTVWSHYLWLKQKAEQQGKFPPSTAPSYPTPGKRFMIIRTELPPAQPGLMVGFDSSNASPASDPSSSPPTDFESMDAIDDAEPGFQKKRTSLLGRLFSFTGSTTVANDLETMRREAAVSRGRPALPPKPRGNASPSGSDSDSIGSSPTYEALFVFKFTLSWNAAGTMSPPNRILTRPRLPTPAQAWVTAKARTGSPPLPPASRPAATRAISGSSHLGLVDSAKNADPSASGVPSSPPRLSLSFDRGHSLSPGSPTAPGSDELQLQSPETLAKDELPFQGQIPHTQEPIVVPAEPKGPFAMGVKYAGRALAEWSLVVAECNSFVDRRREEGVPRLCEVEVPALGVEGFRKIG
ncbi:DUF1765-domain-containing protein [Durotheca rogersii]|uniref:DUF1765-domain-containing protein n=1 Tax=Durotheca rogersii TaxID=419775 RepID=UPI00221EF9D3|nr:DUF1765-domain-containing protein [Durotheca rogersii]KAI5865186.1 DUF1765-domain-containing protein [Durotheca rogersii]